MQIRFLVDGESPTPGVGVFEKGQMRDLPTAIADSLIKSGMVERVEAREKNKGRVQEVKENGGD